ncbi:putative ABC transport system transmembrane protein [Streptomyces ambofaciens ATCC 23877]|uniref:Putative ABC transport system transmembrane protein n=1 Tax=Streptomyces ambofaciens (strain ATCC 23877 / 3486 / DSM 40053 / JCM 4204 / NBRC 12836 / NRRL B-2516) TaxID=278992 RepID=A0A0K2ATY8_STRA7|nr:putative ABC transport system transmembrane protein [Streptomyces ambofaciens ATCC 23877]
MTPALAGPVRRTLPWRALLAAGVLGLLVAAAPALTGAEPTPWQTLTLLRGTALIGALGLAFLLDDPARHLTTAVPTRRPLRQALRVALVAPAAVLWWAAVLLLVPAASRPPAGDITLEAGATGALALAGAAAVVRLTDEARPGPVVAAALLLAAVLAPLLTPEDWAMFTTPGDPRWSQGHDRWAVLTAAAVTVWAACGPEPLGRRGRRPRGAGGPA